MKGKQVKDRHRVVGGPSRLAYTQHQQWQRVKPNGQSGASLTPEQMAITKSRNSVEFDGY